MRELEGFAVPVGDTQAARPLLAIFHQSKGNPSDSAGGTWSDTQLEELQEIVGTIPLWHTERTGVDERRAFLALDLVRLDGLTEAWVPVQGPGAAHGWQR